MKRDSVTSLVHTNSRNSRPGWRFSHPPGVTPSAAVEKRDCGTFGGLKISAGP